MTVLSTHSTTKLSSRDVAYLIMQYDNSHLDQIKSENQLVNNFCLEFLICKSVVCKYSTYLEDE